MIQDENTVHNTENLSSIRGWVKFKIWIDNKNTLGLQKIEKIKLLYNSLFSHFIGNTVVFLSALFYKSLLGNLTM